MKKITYSLGIFVLMMMFTGCAGVGKHEFALNDQYVAKANTKINIGAVKKNSSTMSDANIEQILKDAISEKLTQKELLWQQDINPKLTLNIKILEYSEGNAYKRWLAPGAGWGATSLLIKADLKDGDVLIGTGKATRSVSAGGVGTIGAWKYVFTDLAEDLVNDLKSAYEKQKITKLTLATTEILH